MAEPLADRVIKRIGQAAELYHRLVVLVAPAGAGKTAALQDVHERTAAPLINVNLELSLALLDLTERQLCTYAHILERRHGRHVDRLLLYWTSEPRKQDALMVLPYDPKRAEEAGRYFDETVRRIQAREFAVATPPEPGICLECDLRMLCRSEGIITGAD